jgi:hypothetical protein
MKKEVLCPRTALFSKWEQIFKDPMTTAAAIDRLVHHSVILELNVPSYRLEQANKDRSTNQAWGHTTSIPHRSSLATSVFNARIVSKERMKKEVLCPRTAIP